MMTTPSPWSSATRAALVLFCGVFITTISHAQVLVRTVKVLGSKDTVEIEVEASARITPDTQVLTGPDRLVVDFPNAMPSSNLRSQSIDRGEVKDVRVGLFQSKPPITRVVLDLKSARSYQIFPSGRTVMIRVTGSSEPAVANASNGGAAPVATNYTSRSGQLRPLVEPQTPLQITYRDGLLGVHSNKATLSEVLYAIQQRTGADISIAAGAEQERVVTDIDPAPAPEVIARLLNGSPFNFLILSATDDPSRLDRVILTTRPEAGFAPPPAPSVQNENEPTEAEPPVPVQDPPNNVAPPVPPPPPQAQPEAQAPEDPQEQ